MKFQRRDVLKTAAALPLVAVAGCTGVLANEDNEQPAYAEDLPGESADDADGVFFVHIDAAWLRTFDDEEEHPYSNELPDVVEFDVDPDSAPLDVDPLVAYPTAGLFIGALSLGFGLFPYGFGDVILGNLDDALTDDEAGDGDTNDGTDDDIDGSVRIDSMLLVDGVGVFRGDFDARTIVAASDGFEPAGERDGFDIYEGTEEGFLGTDGLQFAVQNDVLVTLLDEDSDLETVLDAIAGDGDRLSDDDDGGWALSTAGHGHVTLGAWGVNPDEAPDEEGFDREFVDTGTVFQNADGLVSSFTFGPEEGRGSIAAYFPAGETPQRAAIENQVGTSASTRDIQIDGARVAVTGTWRVSTEDDG